MLSGAQCGWSAGSHPFCHRKTYKYAGIKEKKNKNKAAGELEHILINDDQGSRYSYGKLWMHSYFISHINVNFKWISVPHISKEYTAFRKYGHCLYTLREIFHKKHEIYWH